LAYDPVCDVTTGLEYFSPCFAGCNLASPEHAVFHNCTCLPVTSNRSVVTGRCGLEEESCNMMYVFLPTFLLLIFANFIITVPALNVTLR
jgi:organic anion transporter 4A